MILHAIAFLALATPGQRGMYRTNGFAPDAETATEIARAIFRNKFGWEYLRRVEPLVARRRHSRWIVEGTNTRAEPNELLHPFIIAIDPATARVVAFHYLPDMVEKALRETPPDAVTFRAKEKRGSRQKTNRARGQKG